MIFFTVLISYVAKNPEFVSVKYAEEICFCCFDPLQRILSRQKNDEFINAAAASYAFFFVMTINEKK